MSKIHIGEKINEVIKRRGMTVTELANRLGKARQTVTGYLSQGGIQTDILHEISVALEWDFFQYYRIETPTQSPKAASGIYVLIPVAAENAGPMLKAAFGEYSANVIQASLPDASQG